MKNYNLIKLSEPGFDLRTEHIEHVRNVLNLYVCTMCRNNHGTVYDRFPENFDELTTTEQVGVLLSTDCGAEFSLEEE